MWRLGALLAGVLLATTAASVAVADGNCPDGTAPQPVDGGGLICIPVADPGGGGGDGGSGNGSDGGAGQGDDVCNLSLASPQPPASDPAWGGHSPDDGKLFLCILPGTGTPTYRFVPNGGTAPDPAALARRALDELRLTVPDIHLAPAPPTKIYVGLDTWLWLPGSQWSTLTKSVTAGATTVTVRAVPEKVAWDMGPSSTTCHDAGRPWQVGRTARTATTTCKYVYKRVSDFQTGRKFPVTATITFDVTWTCTGNCLADEGALGDVDGLPGRSAVRVGERQSVNVSPDRRN